MLGSVAFLSETEEGIDQFVEEYVLDAIDRVEQEGICDGFSFDRDEQLNPNGDSVVLMVASDFDAFVEHERGRWQNYREEGVIDGWKTRRLSEEQLASQFGDRGLELARRLMPLSGKMSRVAYEELEGESRPPVGDAFPDENASMSVGWWLVLHHITVGNLGYSPQEELRMHRLTFEEDLRLIAEREGPEAVDVEIDEFIDALEAMRDDVKEGRARSND